MEHQDWNTVVFNKKKPMQKETTHKKSVHHSTVSSIANKPAWKIEQQIDNCEGKPIQYVTREDARKIIDGRVAMKLSQKDLANRLNMSVKEIQEIEACKSVENKAKLSKIKRILNIM